MNKLTSIMWYECATSVKFIGIFYAIQYLIVLSVYLIIGENAFSGIETSSMVYVGILGVLGFKEDFRMLIQNGFTRKYIFIATLSMFAFLSGILAIVDTIMGHVLNSFMHGYSSFYGMLYGYNNIVMNFLWLFMLYMLICCLAYLIILIINRLGKTKSMFAGLILGGVILMGFVLCRHYLSDDVLNNIKEVFMELFGFSLNGEINYFTPILTLLVMAGVFSIISYPILKRTELK